MRGLHSPIHFMKIEGISTSKKLPSDLDWLLVEIDCSFYKTVALLLACLYPKNSS